MSTVGFQHGVTSIMFAFVCFLARLDEKDVIGPFRRFRLYALRPTAGNQQCVMHVVMVPRGFCFGGFYTYSSSRFSDEQCAIVVADEVSNCPLTAPDANCSWQHSKRIVLYASKPTVGSPRSNTLFLMPPSRPRLVRATKGFF